MVTPKYPSEISEAIRLYQAGHQDESRNRLQSFLLEQPGTIDALLWLARLSNDSEEAVAAADLALKLDPRNQIAQRAVVSVHRQEGQSSQQRREPTDLQSAITLTTGMTLAQARAMVWPFQRINRPIGEVLDDRTIAQKDLAWAMENAKDSRLRDAARTILLTSLLGVETREMPAPLTVITGSRYTEWQERVSLNLAAMLLGVVIVLLFESILLAVTLAVLRRGYGLEFPWWASAIPVVVMGGLALLLHPVERWQCEAEQYRHGRWGEEGAVDALRLALDGRWTLFRSIEWPDRKWGDVDLVLVGPGGVWAIEVKAYSIRVKNVGDRWERRGRGGWHRLARDPGRQARRNAVQLKEHLNKHGVAVAYVKPAIIWAGEPDLLTVRDPATPVWTLVELEEKSDLLWYGQGLSDVEMRRAVEVLRQMVGTATEKPPKE